MFFVFVRDRISLPANFSWCLELCRIFGLSTCISVLKKERSPRKPGQKIRVEETSFLCRSHESTAMHARARCYTGGTISCLPTVQAFFSWDFLANVSAFSRILPIYCFRRFIVENFKENSPTRDSEKRVPGLLLKVEIVLRKMYQQEKESISKDEGYKKINCK